MAGRKRSLYSVTRDAYFVLRKHRLSARNAQYVIRNTCYLSRKDTHEPSMDHTILANEFPGSAPEGAISGTTRLAAWPAQRDAFARGCTRAAQRARAALSGPPRRADRSYCRE